MHYAFAGSQPVTVSPNMDFSLRDLSGHVYPQTMVPGSPQPPSGAIRPGDTISGGLRYEVGMGTDLRLFFTNAGADQAPMVIDLGLSPQCTC